MIFSIFGKKNRAKKTASADPATDPSTIQTKTGTVVDAVVNANVDFASSIMAQRHIARATERKIDAIEFEMSRDIIKRKSSPHSEPTHHRPNANTNLFDDNVNNSPGLNAHLNQSDQVDPFEPTIPLTDTSTDYFLYSNADVPDNQAEIENISALEEVAILFASEQVEAAELILQNLIQNEKRDAVNFNAWLMLFDLYQITNNQVKFEQLGLDYVNKLEISAPVWKATPTRAPKETEGVIPRISFSGKLDAKINAQINQLDSIANNLATQHQQLQLEFIHISEVDVSGCELLLKGLQTLKKPTQELIVTGAHDLIKCVRSLIVVGRRDEGEAPWLLLLELLQLINDEPGFEEASIDYCITYEISPPPFEAPKNKIINSEAAAKNSTVASTNTSIDLIEPNQFLLPTIIEGDVSELVSHISEVAQKCNALHLDCSQLNQISFHSCGQLLEGLIPLSKHLPSPIEFHDANHLVSALLNTMGFKNIAIISPRKR